MKMARTKLEFIPVLNENGFGAHPENIARVNLMACGTSQVKPHTLVLLYECQLA